MRLVANLFVGAWVILLGGLPLLGGCGEEPVQEPATPVAEVELPEQQIFDYRLIESAAGVKQWILESTEMRKYPGQKDMILSDVHMDFYREGEHFSVLEADSGRANTKTRDVHTWGNVVLVTDDGRRLETEELSFSNQSGMIHNDVFNRFTRGEEWMTGIGLDATPDLDYFEMRSDAQAEVHDGSDLSGIVAPPGNPEKTPEETPEATPESDSD